MSVSFISKFDKAAEKTKLAMPWTTFFLLKNLKEFLQEQKLHSEKRNMGHTSKFRLLKPPQWHIHDLVMKTRDKRTVIT